MKYQVAIAGFILFLIGFILSSRAYDFVCGCTTPNPVNDPNPCYQCMNSPKYQNDMLIFQLIMIVSIFVVLYGFFSEFDYGANK
jgi:hypothetical protein